MKTESGGWLNIEKYLKKKNIPHRFICNKIKFITTYGKFYRNLFHFITLRYNLIYFFFLIIY